MDRIIGLITRNKFVFAGLVLLLLLVILVYARYLIKRRYKKDFDALEIRYNELMSIPVLFKINKASGLAKVTPEVGVEVERCKDVFEDLNRRQDELTEMMGEAEDAIAFGKLKLAKVTMSDLTDLTEETLRITKSLDTSLDDLLEQERKQRVEITELKEKFRNLKTRMNENSNIYGDAFLTLELKTKDIEHNFSAFEEWMFASNFEKARTISEETDVLVVQLASYLDAIPGLYEQTKGIIPGLLENVSKLYQMVKVDDVFVDHLEVAKNIGLISEILKDDLVRIGQCDIENAQSSIEESKKRLEQMRVSIEKENTAHKDLKAQTQYTFNKLEALEAGVDYLQETAEKDALRFNFNNHSETIAEYQVAVERFKDIQAKLERMTNQERLPASTVLVSLIEMKQDLELLEERFNESKNLVEKAKADEIRAQQQLLKLYLIINDVQVRIKNRSVDSISEKYNEDLVKAGNYTKQIKSLLAEEVIDVTTLNATVSEAIDYIYKLHNNVNNLVGVVDMCENALVYANKFRAYVPDIDDELTRAEIAFNNGEYTSALTTIINSIDRYKPNINYEEMIQNNAKSAR